MAAAAGASTEAALRDDPFALNDPLSRGLRDALVTRSRFIEDESVELRGDGCAPVPRRAPASTL